VSYCLSAQNQAEHRSTFKETMWYLTPLIFESNILSMENIDSVSKCLELIWKHLKHNKSWHAFLRGVASRVYKRNGIKYNGFTSRNKKCVKLLNLFIERNTSDNNRILCLTVYMMFIERVNKRDLHRVLEICLSAFKDHSEEGKMIQDCLSRVLVELNRECWTEETLGYLRLIDRNKCKGCKDILFACFSTLKHSGYKDMYFPDIARGLRTNISPWIDILSGFISKKVKISPLKFRAYYPILKEFLTSKRALLGTEESALLKSVFSTFCKVLRLSGIVSVEDWKILGMYCDLIPSKDLMRLLTGSVMPSSEATIEKLILKLLSEEAEEADGFGRASALVRLFDESSQPAVLGLKIVVKADLKERYSLDQAQWYALLHFAEVTDEIHEICCDIFLQCTDFEDSDYIDICAVKFCLLVVERRKSIKNDSMKNLIEHITPTDSSDDLQAINFYQACILLAASDDPKYASKKLGLSSESCFKSAAYWRHLHKTQPRKVKIAKFKKAFISIVDYIFDEYTTENEITTSSFVLIDLLLEFENETYFDELRTYAVNFCLDIAECSHVFAPRYLLSEAMRCAKENVPVSKEVRTFLFDVKFWFNEGEMCSTTTFLCQKEWLEILGGVQKFAINGSFDSELVVFASSLYFMGTYNDSNTQVFKELILSQLAKVI
jgi:hypothetical protein